MDQEIKARWLQALRSGTYKQGTEALCSLDNKFCCLGVLCDIYAKEHNIEWDNNGKKEDDYGTPTKSICDQSLVLPDEVMDWADLPDSDPRISDHHISTYNDRGMPFNTIADLIEEVL